MCINVAIEKMQVHIGSGNEWLWFFLFFVAYRTMLIYKYLAKNSEGVIYLLVNEHLS
jgi:hypothetical protein